MQKFTSTSTATHHTPPPPLTREFLEQQRAHAAHLRLLLDEDLEVLVDDGDGEQDTRARADGAEEVGEDRQGSDAEASEGSRSWDVSVELVDHGVVSVAAHHHLLLFELLGDLGIDWWLILILDFIDFISVLIKFWRIKCCRLCILFL